MKTISLPAKIADFGLRPILSLSGGKDSIATHLALEEAGIDHSMVLADTDWESKSWPAYLEYLRSKVGRIDVVGAPGGMRAQIRAQKRFPARMQRWCTRELKLKPLRDYHDAYAAMAGVDTLCVIGVRAEESAARAKMPELEDDDMWNGWVWRPLINWTIEDVLNIHHRHGIEVNPVYLIGHERFGCYPCVNSTKEEIRLIDEHEPEKLDEIEALEAEVNAARAAEGLTEEATFFRTRASGPSRPWPMVEVRAWAKTARGGVKLRVLDTAPDGGCFRWGLCEPPALHATAESPAVSKSEGEKTP